MVRTKADGGGRKAVAAKAPRKVLGANTSSGAGGSMMSPKGGKYSGGNPACDRSTPEWQKDISKFFNAKTQKEKENANPESHENDDVDVCSHSETTGSTPGEGSSKNMESCSSSAVSQESLETKPESSESPSESPTESPAESPVKKTKKKQMKQNNIIDSDSD